MADLFSGALFNDAIEEALELGREGLLTLSRVLNPGLLTGVVRFADVNRPVDGSRTAWRLRCVEPPEL